MRAVSLAHLAEYPIVRPAAAARPVARATAASPMTDHFLGEVEYQFYWLCLMDMLGPAWSVPPIYGYGYGYILGPSPVPPIYLCG